MTARTPIVADLRSGYTQRAATWKVTARCEEVRVINAALLEN
jgi:hypothetical protein